MIRLHWLAYWSAFLASPVLAEKVCDPQDPKSCVQAVTAGEVVPFDGQLLTPRRAARLAVAADGCVDRVGLAIEEQKAVAAQQIAGERSLRANEVVSCKLQTDTLTKRMVAMEEILTPKWYERPAFVAIVSSAVTVALLVVSVKAVQTLK